eukprot:m.98461 g.98461  ORF g.98461 m.98461 type:complete len:452 (-) comp22104_c0_seq4:150-1505(-)
MEELPLEILEQILEYNNQRDLARLSRCCKWLRRTILSSPLLYSKLMYIHCDSQARRYLKPLPQGPPREILCLICTDIGEPLPHNPPYQYVVRENALTHQYDFLSPRPSENRPDSTCNRETQITNGSHKNCPLTNNIKCNKTNINANTDNSSSVAGLEKNNAEDLKRVLWSQLLFTDPDHKPIIGIFQVLEINMKIALLKVLTDTRRFTSWLGRTKLPPNGDALISELKTSILAPGSWHRRLALSLYGDEHWLRHLAGIQKRAGEPPLEFVSSHLVGKPPLYYCSKCDHSMAGFVCVKPHESSLNASTPCKSLMVLASDGTCVCPLNKCGKVCIPWCCNRRMRIKACEAQLNVTDLLVKLSESKRSGQFFCENCQFAIEGIRCFTCNTKTGTLTPRNWAQHRIWSECNWSCKNACGRTKGGGLINGARFKCFSCSQSMTSEAEKKHAASPYF